MSTKKLVLKMIAFLLGAIIFFATWICFFTLLDATVANAATKYTKVKTTTYKKYKKAYKVAVPKLKKEVKTLKKSNASLNSAKVSAEKALSTANANVDKYKSINSWLWDAFEDLGYAYDSTTKHWEATPDGNLCLECGKYFPLPPKGSGHYKYCPYCGSNNLE